MLRKFAIAMYGFGSLATLWLMTVFFSANAHLPWEWRVDYLAASFVPMLLLMLGVLYVQIKSPKVSWLLIPIVLIASVSLFYSMALHGFPEKSKLIGMVHLVIVFGVLAWIFLQPKFFGVWSE